MKHLLSISAFCFLLSAVAQAQSFSRTTAFQGSAARPTGGGGGGDVSFVSVSTTASGGSGANPLNHNHQVTNTLTSGYILVQVAGWSSYDGTTNSAVTFDSAPMVFLGHTNVDNFGEFRAYLWGLKTNKASGTYTVGVTHNYTAGTDEINIGCLAFDNVNASPVGTAVGASGSSTTAAVGVGSAAGDMATVVTLSSRNHSPGGGETERWDSTATIDDGASGMTEAAVGATTTMTTTLDGTSTTWLTFGVSIKK